MQETKRTKTRCRCCGHRFPVGKRCPNCQFPVYIVFEQEDSKLNAKAEQYYAEHKDQIVVAAGIIFNEPARWDGDQLVPGKQSYLELANLEQMSEEFQWAEQVEFASFGRGEDANLRIFLEHADGSNDERMVPIKLPPVRGVTWKAAIRINEACDGVEFAVGVPERYTTTETVKFCD